MNQPMYEDDSGDPVQTLGKKQHSTSDSLSFGERIEFKVLNCEQQAECHSSINEMKDSTVDLAKSIDVETVEMLGELPPEIAMLLIVSGIVGVLLPGPVGTPLLIAGGFALWPKTFQPIERWFSKRFPVFHREGVCQIKDFLADLQKRFPEKVKNN